MCDESSYAHTWYNWNLAKESDSTSAADYEPWMILPPVQEKKVRVLTEKESRLGMKYRPTKFFDRSALQVSRSTMPRPRPPHLQVKHHMIIGRLTC